MIFEKNINDFQPVIINKKLYLRRSDSEYNSGLKTTSFSKSCIMCKKLHFKCFTGF